MILVVRFGGVECGGGGPAMYRAAPNEKSSRAGVSSAEAENPALCFCSEHSTSDTSVILESLVIGRA